MEIDQLKELRLTDIAQLTGFSAADLEILAQTKIDASLSAHGGAMSRSEISRQMRAIVSRLSVRPQITLPASVRIAIGGKTLTRKWVSELIENEVRNHCRDCEFQLLNLDFQNTPSGLVQRHELIVRQFKGGSFHWPLVVFQGGKKQVIPIKGYLKLYKMGPVANRQLRAGDRLRPEDMIVERLDVTHQLQPIAREWIGQKIKRSLRSGQTLFQDDLAREKLVRAGSPVQLVVKHGLLNVKMGGLAVSSGDRGDLIKVRTDKTKRLVSAVIIDRGVVRVQ